MNDSQIVKFIKQLDPSVHDEFLEAACANDEVRDTVLENLHANTEPSADQKVSLLTASPVNAVKIIGGWFFSNSLRIAKVMLVLAVIGIPTAIAAWKWQAANELGERLVSTELIANRAQQDLSETTKAFGKSFFKLETEKELGHRVQPSAVALRFWHQIRDNDEIEPKSKKQLTESVIKGLHSQHYYVAALDVALWLKTMCEKEFGSESIEYFESTSLLGTCYLRSGHRDEAYFEYSTVTEAVSRIYGQDHPLVFETQMLISDYLVQLRNLSRADQYLETALGKYNKEVSPTSPERLRTLVQLANSSELGSNYRRAIQLWKERFELLNDSLEPTGDMKDPLTALFLAYMKSGNKVAALELVEGELAIRREKYGENDVRTASAMTLLSQSHLIEGKSRKAAQVQHEVVDTYSEKYGEGHPRVAMAKMGLARCYLSMGEQDKFQEWLVAAAELDAELLAKATQEQLNRLEDMSEEITNPHFRADLSLKILNVVYQEKSRRYGVDHALTRQTLRPVSLAYYGLGETMRCLNQLFDLIDLNVEYCGTQAQYTRVLCNSARMVIYDKIKYVDEWITQGDFKTAAKYLTEMRRFKGYFENPIQRLVLRRATEAALGQQDYEATQEAVDSWIERIENYKPVRAETAQGGNLDPEPNHVAQAWTIKSFCLAKSGKFREARVAAERAMAIRQIEPVDDLRCKAILGVCLASDNQLQKAVSEAEEAFRAFDAQLSADPRTLSLHLPLVCQCLIQIHEIGEHEEKIAHWKSRLEKLREQVKQRRLFEL